MEFLQYSKMQLACLMILIGIGMQLIRSGKNTECNKFFDALFILAEIAVFFDGLTAWSVNSTDVVSHTTNIIFHFCFFTSLNSVLYVLLLYFANITKGLPWPTVLWKKCLMFLPLCIMTVCAAVCLKHLDFISGKITNYSMGKSAIITFLFAGLLILGSVAVLFLRFRYIEKRKRVNILFCAIIAVVFTILQFIFPEILTTSLCVTLFVISCYINIENPDLKTLQTYHSEMLMGFATLLENRDDSTGGHIKRTTEYVKLIMDELLKIKKYRRIFTKDYIDAIEKAAPMHDIGKISIPDAILQKPGKLTDEEFAVMKTHSVRGGEIILETFGHLANDKTFGVVAFKVATYHHEKWNGKGYPEGLSEKNIPLCARIMAVADVFDAVSAKRCYRDAMPLETCFEIIKNGRGTDFDPEIVDVFLNARPKVEKIYHQTFG